MDGCAQCRLGVLACTRSGTLFTIRLLTALGLDVRHEGLGADGGVGFNFMFRRTQIEGDATNPRRIGGGAVWFQTLWHQIREPLATIASLHTHGAGTWRMVAQGLGWPAPPGDPLERAALWWLEGNRLAAERAEWSYRLEDLRPDGPAFFEMCRRLGVAAVWPPVEPCNSRRDSPHRRPVSWALLHERLPALAVQMAVLAGRYGYPVTDG